MFEIIIVRAGQNVSLDPTQSGFAHGFGIFETIKLETGRLSFWSAHWARLQASAKALKLPLPCDSAEVLRAVRELVAADALTGGLIKLSLVREGADARLFVYARAAAPRPESVQLKLDVRYPINEHSLLAGHKTHNYMEHLSLLEAARREGYFDVLRVNVAGFLAETTVGNLFCIVDGTLRTPGRATGILPGVIRGEVLRLNAVEEGRYEPDILQASAAVFMTNAAYGILPVARVEGMGLALEFQSAAHPLFEALTCALAVSEAKHAVCVAPRDWSQ